MNEPQRSLRSDHPEGQTTTEYILILFLAVSLFTFTAKTLGPILRKVVKAQSERLEKQFSEGLYRFRLPGRG